MQSYIIITFSTQPSSPYKMTATPQYCCQANRAAYTRAGMPHLSSYTFSESRCIFDCSEVDGHHLPTTHTLVII